MCRRYVHAYTDANSCTTIAKAGKRRRRGGSSREEDAARPEGGSRHHGPDAEMPGQERPVVASIPDDFPGSSLPAAVWRCPRQPAQTAPRRCCSGPSLGTGQLSGAHPFPPPAPPPSLRPPADSAALAAAARSEAGKEKDFGKGGDRIIPLSLALCLPGELEPFH